MISLCVVVDTGVVLCGRSVGMPSEEKSWMIELTMQWRRKVLSGWRVKRTCSFQYCSICGVHESAWFMPKEGVGVEEVLSVIVAEMRLGCRLTGDTFVRCNKMMSMVVLVGSMIDYYQVRGRLLEPMLRCVYPMDR